MPSSLLPMHNQMFVTSFIPYGYTSAVRQVSCKQTDNTVNFQIRVCSRDSRLEHETEESLNGGNPTLKLLTKDN